MDMIELLCECGGYIYRKGLNDDSYACVRCEQSFTKSELDTKWLKEFEEKHTLLDNKKLKKNKK